jgi:predicted metal-binding protein
VRDSNLAPRRQLFVCANRREGSPLGPGCSTFGDALYDALKREVAVRGLVQSVWITKTHCLGICPKRGATVARYGGDHAAIVTEATADDAAALLDDAAGPDEPSPSISIGELEREVDALVELQTQKVLDSHAGSSPG